MLTLQSRIWILKSPIHWSIIEANTLKDWLVSISDSDLDLLSFCRLCYEARDSEGLKVVEQRAKKSSIHEDNTSYEAEFARIRHFMGRMGSYLKAAWILVEAGKHHPQLQYLQATPLKSRQNIWSLRRRLIEQSLRLTVSSTEWWRIPRPANTTKKSSNPRMKNSIFY